MLPCSKTRAGCFPCLNILRSDWFIEFRRAVGGVAFFVSLVMVSLQLYWFYFKIFVKSQEIVLRHLKLTIKNFSDYFGSKRKNVKKETEKWNFKAHAFVWSLVFLFIYLALLILLLFPRLMLRHGKQKYWSQKLLSRLCVTLQI